MKKERDSNMELLRMIAMGLVLLVHADFFSLGAPSNLDAVQNPLDSSLRVFFGYLAWPCVDIFILLSGWYGIKPSIKGACNFIFQCLFWLIGIYVVTLLTGISELSIEGLKGCICATALNWFIKAYLLLYIISPVLNSFVEKADKRTYLIVLVAFYIFQSIYGWIFPEATHHLDGGYSTISFVGLYLLARYMNIHKDDIFLFRYSFRQLMSLIVAITLSVTMLYITPPHWGISSGIAYRLFFSYISPFTILVALCWVIAFSKLKFQSKVVNLLAKGCFAAFLIHTNPNTLFHYKELFIYLHSHYSTFAFWMITFVLIVLIYLTAIIIDRLRQFLWKLISSKIERQCIYDTTQR